MSAIYIWALLTLNQPTFWIPGTSQDIFLSNRPDVTLSKDESQIVEPADVRSNREEPSSEIIRASTAVPSPSQSAEDQTMDSTELASAREEMDPHTTLPNTCVISAAEGSSLRTAEKNILTSVPDEVRTDNASSTVAEIPTSPATSGEAPNSTVAAPPFKIYDTDTTLPKTPETTGSGHVAEEVPNSHYFWPTAELRSRKCSATGAWLTDLLNGASDGLAAAQHSQNLPSASKPELGQDYSGISLDSLQPSTQTEPPLSFDSAALVQSSLTQLPINK